MISIQKCQGYGEIKELRELYRQEMDCQIIHDNLHFRPGWTVSYILKIGGVNIGYGSIAIGGPWTGNGTIFEFYLLSYFRDKTFQAFSALLEAAAPIGIEIQTNGPLMTSMIFAFGREIQSESILFKDGLTTSLGIPNVVFREKREGDRWENREDEPGEWVLEANGKIAATGGILFHYNRPYGDIYMEVDERYRRLGYGSFLVQELKRTCYESGSVPAARCNVKNIPSRFTLQKAGFVPCGHILAGAL